ncbi:hypothetical protein TNCV_534441 [Trichonephila clavipes]|nr:hypothetical protein TNCV_534441 [Trichonephila clavipes]
MIDRLKRFHVKRTSLYTYTFWRKTTHSSFVHHKISETLKPTDMNWVSMFLFLRRDGRWSSLGNGMRSIPPSHYRNCRCGLMWKGLDWCEYPDWFIGGGREA